MKIFPNFYKFYWNLNKKIDENSFTNSDKFSHRIPHKILNLRRNNRKKFPRQENIETTLSVRPNLNALVNVVKKTNKKHTKQAENHENLFLNIIFQFFMGRVC
jgi:hypothetical protein